MGCLNVYTILRESGVIASGQDVRETEVFKRSLAMGLISNPGEREPEVHPIPPDAPTKETLLHVSGMWCSACSWLIEHSLKKERGVVSAEAFFASDLVKVSYCPQYLPPERITKRIEQLGYIASEFDPDGKASAAEKRDMVLRIGVAGFLWMNIMTLSVPLYVGYFQEINPGVKSLFPFILMLLAAPVVFYSAMPILKLAWTGLLNKTIRMETLLATGILAAYVHSSIQAFRGETVVYFDTAAAIVTLVLLGKMMEKGAKERTTRAISMLYRLMPKKVRLFVDRAERFVSIDALKQEDVFMVKAGERIPADGIIIDGDTYTDESLLTGESTPISRNVGSTVVSGSLNTGNVILVRATKVGEDTTLSQIIGLVERAISSRSALERTVDKVSRVFVPSVIAFAAVTFAVCYGFGFTTTDEALMRAITILVIACPCALGLATPLAITAAVGQASREGILIGDSSILEKIRNIDAVVFDKTGTITEGSFELVGVTLAVDRKIRMPAFVSAGPAAAASSSQRLDAMDMFEDDHLPLIAALERYSEHPLGKAIVQHAERCLLNLSEAANVRVEKGLGIAGEVNGRTVAVGNRRFIEESGPCPDAAIAARVADWESSGMTTAYFAIDGKMAGAVAFGDHIREDAASVIGRLKTRGVRTIVVSGDAPGTTRYVAGQIGADDHRSGALPADKVTAIERLQQEGATVAMIGDGINDAPALATADLGIAMGSGTDIAMKAADVVLVGNSLEKLLTAFDLSKKTWRIVRQNLFWAFFYNTLGMSLAITGVLNPIMAAAAMFLSSLSVIGNSLRLGGRPAADVER